MINHDKVKKISAEMLEVLTDMEEVAVKFKPKTDTYDASIGDDISASAKVLMEEIIKIIRELKKVVTEKTSGVNNFTTKLGASERKNVGRINNT